MPGAPVSFGSFSGGINTQSDPSAIADFELVDAVNFEVDLDGSLKSRPPVVRLNDTPDTSRMLLLGYAYLMEGTYLIGSNSTGIYYYLGGAWTLITNTIRATSMAQFQNKIWIPSNPPDTNNSGGWWHPTNGWNPIGAMPKGQSILAHKGRLYIAPGLLATTNRARLYYSGVDVSGNLDPTVWSTSSDYVDINAGDGQILIEIIVFNDNLTAFKQDSTYIFAFDTSPKQGVVRKLSATIGATRTRCVVLYENSCYIYHEGEVYEMINYDFNRLNTKVPFIFDSGAPGPFSEEVSLCTFGDRLVCRYYNRVYVFGFRTRSWTRWESVNYYGPLVQAPSDVIRDVNEIYYSGSCISDRNRMFQVNDGFDLSQSEEMTCSIRTKNFDMNTSHKFKRLFYWGVDLLSVDPVEGSVTPVLSTYSTKWQDCTVKKWSELNTWGYPLTAPPTSITVIPAGSPTVRMFLKFLKGIRFRQAYFVIKFTTNGTLQRGPVRLFGITLFVRVKEDAVKAAS